MASTTLVATAADPLSATVLRVVALALAAALLATGGIAGTVRPASAATVSTPTEIATWFLARVEQAGTNALATTESSVPLSSGQSENAQLRPGPRPGPFSMNLYRDGDFASQKTEYWCVAASAQTMMNIIDSGKPDSSRAFQRRLQFQAKRLFEGDDDGFWRRITGEERWRKGYHGLGLQHWTALLNTNGYGPYEIDRAPTRKRAIRKAARAIRLTGKPAGLVVWRGAHAWVMSGFDATADPAYTNEYRVTDVNIQDPWYPMVSSIWGASRRPNASVPVRALGEDYLRYDRPRRRHPKRDGKFMLILPAVPTAGA